MAGEGAKLATGWLELTVSTQGAQKDITDAVVPAAERAGTEGGKRMGSGILGAIKGIAGPLAAVMGGAAIAGWFSDGIAAASDFTEAGTAISQVFGDQATAIQDFAKGGAAAFGQTTNEVLAGAQTFGVYGKAAGLAGGDLTGFATDLSSLSTDLASFYNTDPSEAMEAIAAGLRGEAEPLRKYGVLLDDATLKARAMEMGLYDGSGALTQQQKIMASQAEILAQTSDAQGDFARTSGGLANQQRVLSAGWQNFQASVGAMLLPALTSIVTLLAGTVMPALQGFADNIGPIFSGMGSALQPVFDALAPVFTQIGAVFTGLMPTLAPLVGQFLELAMSVSPLGMIIQALLPILPSLIALFGEVATTVGGVLGEAMTSLTPIVSQLATLFSGTLVTVIEALLPVVTTLAGIFSTVLAAVLPTIVPLIGLIAERFAMVLESVLPIVPILLKLIEPILGLLEPLGMLVQTLLPPLIELFTSLLTPILGLISPLLDSLMPAITFVADVLSFLIGIIAEVLTWLIELVTGTGDAGDEFMAVFNAVMSFFAGVGAFFASMWAGIVAGFQAGWQNIVSFFQDLPGNITGFFSGVGDWLWDAGRDLIDGLLGGIRSLAGTIGNFFLDLLPDWIVGPFKAALGIASPSKLFHEFGEDTMQGYINGVVGMRNAVTGAVVGSTATLTPGSAAGLRSTPFGSGRVTLVDRDGSILTQAEVIADGAVAYQSRRTSVGLTTGRRKLG